MDQKPNLDPRVDFKTPKIEGTNSLDSSKSSSLNSKFGETIVRIFCNFSSIIFFIVLKLFLEIIERQRNPFHFFIW